MQRTTCAILVGGLLVVSTLPSTGTAATPAPALQDVAPAAEARVAPSTGVHDWNNLARVRAGDRVVVTTKRSRLLDGQFVGYTPETMTFTVEGEAVTLDRGSIAEVQSREKSHKVRNAVLTLGVSLLVGWVAATGAEASSDPDQASRAASSASLDAGSATYEALPLYAVIYRAPPPTTR